MYVVVKKIKGRRYLYRQRTWREGKRVRTESVYIGALDGGRGSPGDGGRKRKRGGILGFIEAQRLDPQDRAIAAAEKAAEKIAAHQRATFGETAEERATREKNEVLDELHAAYGMKLGPTTPVLVDAPVATPEAAEPSDQAEGVEGKSA